MIENFNSLDPMLHVFWCIALVASLVFVIQMIISFVGGDVFDDADADFDADADGDAGGVSHFFSVRNLVNFLLGAGWGGVCFYNFVNSKAVLMILAVITGIVFVAIFFALVKILLKLQKDNTFRLTDTVGKTAEVYLAVPAEKSGRGKIQISIRGSVHEIDAVTKGEKIARGVVVKVMSIIDSQTVDVEKV